MKVRCSLLLAGIGKEAHFLFYPQACTNTSCSLPSQLPENVICNKDRVPRHPNYGLFRICHFFSNILFQNMPVPKNPDLNFSSFSPSWNSLGSIPSTDIYKSTKNYKNVSALGSHWLDLGLLSWIFRGCIFLFQCVRDKVAQKEGYFCWESP